MEYFNSDGYFQVYFYKEFSFIFLRSNIVEIAQYLV